MSAPDQPDLLFAIGPMPPCPELYRRNPIYPMTITCAWIRPGPPQCQTRMQPVRLLQQE